MNFGDWIFLIVIVVVALFFLYRTIRKKSWCPDIYGSGSCSVKNDSREDSTTS